MSAIQPGDTVLVTGATGFIGSHVIDQLLAKGIKVRGTVRSAEKGAWVEKLFTEKYGKGNLELVVVPDIAADDAFDEVIKGVHGVAHVAANMTFPSDPNLAIPPSLKAQHHLLTVASQQPALKRFVLTSSTVAVSWVKPNIPDITITASTFNTEAVDRAWHPRPEDSDYDKAWAVYSAAKTQGEQEFWQFVESEKPRFVANTVNPYTVIGPTLDKSQNGGGCVGLVNAFLAGAGWMPFHDKVGPGFHIHVADVARLHVAALIDPDIKNERIFAYGDRFNFDDVLDVLRKAAPDAKDKLPENKGQGRELAEVVPRKRAEEILEKHYQKGWTGLEQTVREQIACL